MRPQPPEWLSGRTVAVVGSGPAGLAAAQQLTRAGHTVAVYERADKLGGLLRYGIPEFKMEKQHLDRRLDQMRREGTVFRSGVDVGGRGDRRPAARSASTRWCSRSGRRCRATCRCPGASSAASTRRWSSCPQANRASLGEERRGPDHRDRQARRDHRRRRHRRGLPGHVHRQGAASVTQLEIMPQPGDDRPASQPWPTYPMMFRVSSAHEEGGERVYAVSTRVPRRRRRQRPRAAPGRGGRASSSRVEGTEREIPAELVLFAMGFTGPEQDGLVEQLGVDLDERGNVARDSDYASSVDGRLRGRRRRPRAVADRVGDRRGAGRRGGRRRVPHRLDRRCPSPIPPTARRWSSSRWRSPDPGTVRIHGARSVVVRRAVGSTRA